MSNTIYNIHPETGEFLTTAIADASPLEPGVYLVPAFATDIAPPVLGVKQAAVFVGGAWQVKADWRAVPLYSTADGSVVTIDAIGQTPAGAGATEVPPPTAQHSWQAGVWVIDAAKVAALLERVRVEARARIDAAYTQAINVIAASYPETERNSWAKQEQEARAWMIDNTTAAPLLTAIAAARGTTLADICARVIANADAYAVYAGGVIGKRQALMLLVDAATTSTGLEAITW